MSEPPIQWVFRCYYCGKEYARIAFAYKHLCKHQPRGLPLHERPVFLLVVKDETV